MSDSNSEIFFTEAVEIATARDCRCDTAYALAGLSLPARCFEQNFDTVVEVAAGEE